MKFSLFTCIAFFLGTALASAQSPPPTKVEIVASGLSQPIGLFAPPNDPSRLFVIEKYGFIRVVKNGVLLNTPFLDISANLAMSSEQGLLGMAFHPRYVQNGYFFVYYTDVANGDVVVARYQVSGNPDIADPASGVVFMQFTHPFGNHNGGALAFSPIDHYLYIASGDGGSGGDPFNYAQNLGSPLGKLLRIDVNSQDAGLMYHIPTSNPFFGMPGAVGEIYAYGLRNPWRIAFDRLTADLYIADVGQGVVEELDFIAAESQGGQNFGWNCMEGDICSNYGTTPGCICGDPSLVAPIHVYNHNEGCAVIGGFVYRGSIVPELLGSYIFLDICSTNIWALQFDGTQVTGVQNVLLQMLPPSGSHTIASMGEDANGELYFAYMSGEIGKIVRNDDTIPGIVPYGKGTDGCNGPHTLTISRTVAPGAVNIDFRADAAPPNALGLLLITDSKAPAPGLDPYLIGANFLVDIYYATVFIPFDFNADENGMADYHFDLVNDPNLVGLKFYGQGIFYFGSPCPPTSPQGFTSSNALEITVLPTP
ncbi:MAG: PQQ-dependent sugar dehydrogenase [Planctomycetes bacterium]|nr:PQQ-dependent sugar dehydrogenase [Planctomycetota bacterium]